MQVFCTISPFSAGVERRRVGGAGWTGGVVGAARRTGRSTVAVAGYTSYLLLGWQQQQLAGLSCGPIVAIVVRVTASLVVIAATASRPHLSLPTRLTTSSVLRSPRTAPLSGTASIPAKHTSMKTSMASTASIPSSPQISTWACSPCQPGGQGRTAGAGARHTLRRKLGSGAVMGDLKTSSSHGSQTRCITTALQTRPSCRSALCCSAPWRISRSSRRTAAQSWRPRQPGSPPSLNSARTPPLTPHHTRRHNILRRLPCSGTRPAVQLVDPPSGRTPGAATA